MVYLDYLTISSQYPSIIIPTIEPAMHEFYPEIIPFNDFLLSVDHQHQIYIEQCGNPNGQPVLFIHGGPGGGCSKNDRRFLILKNIILFYLINEDVDVHCPMAA